MIEHVPWWSALAGYALGWLMGRLDRETRDDPRRRFRFWRRGSNPPPPRSKPQPPSGPPQPLAADLIRYSRWRDEQIRRALTEPIHFDEGRVQRGNSHRPGPYSSHPQGFPPPPPKVGCARWFIINPAMIAECGGPCTIDPSHCDCGALWVDVPTTNQPPEAP